MRYRPGTYDRAVTTGRTIPDPAFPGDDGAADPALAAALRDYAADPDADARVLAALARARVLVPIVALLTDDEAAPPGALRREKSTDMALPTLVGRDGRRALPVFTSVASLARWRADARPVPVESVRAALSAVTESAELMVLDIAGPVTYVVEAPAVRALAQGRDMTPLYTDHHIRRAVDAVVAHALDVRGVDLLPAVGVDATVQLIVSPDARDPRGTAARVAASLAEVEVIRQRVVRGLHVAVVRHSGGPPHG